jgi:hypothetical protein
LSPTSLSLRRLRRLGYLADVCERWAPVPGKDIRRDLFGAFDVAALHLDVPGVLGVQTTALGCLSARVAKLRALPSVAAWLKCGNQVQLHGWTKRGDRWRVRVVELRGEDVRPVVVERLRRRRPRDRHSQGDLS